MEKRRDIREELSYDDNSFTKRLDIATTIKSFLFENPYTNYYSDRRIVTSTKLSLSRNSNNEYKMLEIGTSWFPNFIKILNRKFLKNIYDVTAINISESEINKHRELFRKKNVDGVNQINFHKMNAEKLDFNEFERFDIVIGGAILHHINYEDMLLNLKRHINNKSILVFREPLAHNPIFNLYRFLTPFLHTDDEEPINLYEFIRISKKLNYKLEIIYQEGISPFLFPINILSKILKINKLAKLVCLLDCKFSNSNLFKSFSRIATFILIPTD